MYADDSTIHISGENISDIQTKVQEDLNRIELWCKDNNMFINCNKTKCITVGTKQKFAFQNEELSLTINSITTFGLSFNFFTKIFKLAID